MKLTEMASTPWLMRFSTAWICLFTSPSPEVTISSKPARRAASLAPSTSPRWNGLERSICTSPIFGGLLAASADDMAPSANAAAAAPARMLRNMDSSLKWPLGCACGGFAFPAEAHVTGNYACVNGVLAGLVLSRRTIRNGSSPDPTSPSPRSRATMTSPVRRPISMAGTWTVVSAGETSRPISRSWKPAMPSSSGMAMPSRRHSRMAPTAKTSLVKKTASGRRGEPAGALLAAGLDTDRSNVPYNLDRQAVQSGYIHRRPIALGAMPGALVGLARAVDEDDPPIARIDQRQRHRPRRFAIGEADREIDGLVRTFPGLDDRNACTLEEPPRRRRMGKPGKHDRVGTALEKRADLAFLDVGAIPAVGDDEVEPCGRKHVRHALDGVGEERMTERRNNCGDQSAPPRRQAAGETVGHVAEFAHDAENAIAGVRTDLLGMAEHARDGHLGDAGECGHIGHGRAEPGPRGRPVPDFARLAP